MINYDSLYQKMSDAGLDKWLEVLPAQIRQHMDFTKNGNLKSWLQVLDNLPDINASKLDLNQSFIDIGQSSDCDTEIRQQLETHLRQLIPWRKGPYKLFDIEITTEWRSDWKWDRVLPHLSDLKGRTILDVGCGNGYHSWRMAGAGAKLVIGIDPSLLFVMQYHAVKKYTGDKNVYVLPLKLEDVPENLPCFDTAFSMGILYHRRSPFDHLQQLKNLLKPGGELVLETLVVDGGENHVLVPRDRYAQMNNVWFLPSCTTLEAWLKRAGFVDIRLCDVNQTNVEEQHATDWMKFDSLPEFLDPNNANLTIEGYQAPTRAVFVARKPQP